MAGKVAPTAPAYQYHARVVSVTDGDTIRVDVDLGLGIWTHNHALRFLGVNTPELVGPERNAALRAKDWLSTQLPAGKKILIQTIKDRADKYGRYAADVWVDGLHVNSELLRLGLAKIYIPQPG